MKRVERHIVELRIVERRETHRVTTPPALLQIIRGAHHVGACGISHAQHRAIHLGINPVVCVAMDYEFSARRVNTALP